ncbi:MAG: hypothetical protein K8T89_04920 [Planctomycetes bacterium]|nr:hypothetical protein [Planctomycetota bacterium]
MLNWFRKLIGRRAESPNVPKVRIYPNPLVGLLDDSEAAKGAPLTQEEVIAVRDNAKWIEVTQSQADKFHAAFDAQIQLPRLDPDRIWEEWQALNGREP